MDIKIKEIFGPGSEIFGKNYQDPKTEFLNFVPTTIRYSGKNENESRVQKVYLWLKSGETIQFENRIIDRDADYSYQDEKMNYWQKCVKKILKEHNWPITPSMGEVEVTQEYGKFLKTYKSDNRKEVEIDTEKLIEDFKLLELERKREILKNDAKGVTVGKQIQGILKNRHLSDEDIIGIYINSEVCKSYHEEDGYGENGGGPFTASVGFVEGLIELQPIDWTKVRRRVEEVLRNNPKISQKVALDLFNEGNLKKLY